MNSETCLATDVQRLPDLMRAESEAAALTALGAILLRRETEGLTKALQETRADAVATLKALTQAQMEAEAEALTVADAVRNARVAVATLPDLREALEAGRLVEARVRRESARRRLTASEPPLLPPLTPTCGLNDSVTWLSLRSRQDMKRIPIQSAFDCASSPPVASIAGLSSPQRSVVE